MNIDNLDNNFISFELSDEDVQAIRGGSTTDDSVSNISRRFFQLLLLLFLLKNILGILSLRLFQSRSLIN